MPPENTTATNETVPGPADQKETPGNAPTRDPAANPAGASAGTPGMRKQRLQKDDGRYIIFYDFAEGEGD